MVVADCLVFPVNLFVWIVEGMSSTHFKDGKMPTKGWSYVVNILEPNAWLADDKGVGGRGDYPICNIRLKIDDAGNSYVKIISPSSDYRIRLDSRVAILFEK
jgi:hypothetical protein